MIDIIFLKNKVPPSKEVYNLVLVDTPSIPKYPKYKA